MFCELVRPERLWEAHISALSDDMLFQARRDIGNRTLELTNTDVQNEALYHLQSILNKHRRRLSKFPNMPILTTLPNNHKQGNYLIREEQ